jgi:hypothetical protein
MPYACPAWKFAAETYILKLHRLQNSVLCTIGNPLFVRGFLNSVSL